MEVRRRELLDARRELIMPDATRGRLDETIMRNVLRALDDHEARYDSLFKLRTRE